MDTGEPTILKLHPHWIGYLQFYIVGIILAVGGLVYISFWPAIIFGILFAVLGEILRKATTYYVLDAGIAKGYHFFSTSRKFTEYGSIQNVEVNQSFLENILGIGSVKFDTAGSDVVEVSFHQVKNPYNIEKIARSKMAIK